MFSYLKVAAGSIALSVAVMSAASAQATTLTIDLTNIGSYDERGGANNTKAFYDIGANTLVSHISYDFTVSAYSPSWLSEAAIFIGESTGVTGIVLNPGAAASYAGTTSYSGETDVAFNVGENGLLYTEFFELFNDHAGRDASYLSGTITIGYENEAAVPEPASWAMMIAGFGLVGGAMRRRQTTTLAVA